MPKSLSDTVRVLVADKTPMNGQLLADALAKDDRIKVCGSHSTSGGTLQAIPASKPDVVLLSAHLADGEKKGFEVAREIRVAQPAVLCVILLDVADRPSVIEAFRSGAKGVFSRNDSIKLLAKCVHCVRGGQVWASSTELLYVLDMLRGGTAIAQRTVPAESLSKREYQVCQAVSEGLTNREIAGKLGLTEHTVKGYLYRIFEKLGVSTRVELALHTFTPNPMQAPAKAAAAAASSRDARTAAPVYRRDHRLAASVAVGQLESRY